MLPLPPGPAMPSDWNRPGGIGLIPGLLEFPASPKGKSPTEALTLEVLPFSWSHPIRLYSHLQVPGLAPGVEISPASSILV